MEILVDIKAPGDEWNIDPEEQRTLPFDESTSPDPRGALDAPPASQMSRCESCGRPVDRGLCAACASAFQNVLVPTQDSTPPSETIEAGAAREPQATFPEQPAAIPAPNLDELFAALEIKPRAEIEPAPETPRAHDDDALPIVAASPAIETTVPPALQTAASPAEVKVPAAAIAVAQPAPASEVPKNPQESTKAAPIAKPPVAVPAAVLPPKKSGRSLIAAAAVILVIAAIGIPLTGSWLGRQRLIVAPNQAPVSRGSKPAATAAAPARPSAPAHATAPTVGNPAPVVKAALPVAAPAPVKPALVKSAPVKAQVPPSAPTRAARNDVRVPSRLPKPAAPIASAPAVVAAAPSAIATVAPAPAPVAPEPKAAEPPAGPLGPFFELRQVDQPPQVASRVDPELPESLESGPINEIVIARVLVSQTGHPSLVSLLRRSKAGIALDQAVIAAVKQWTFTPASKGGDAVSCFMAVAVPVRRTE